MFVRRLQGIHDKCFGSEKCMGCSSGGGIYISGSAGAEEYMGCSSGGGIYIGGSAGAEEHMRCLSAAEEYMTYFGAEEYMGSSLGGGIYMMFIWRMNSRDIRRSLEHDTFFFFFSEDYSYVRFSLPSGINIFFGWRNICRMFVDRRNT